MNKKFTYEQPSSELLIVRFEGNIMTSPGNAGGNDTIVDEEEDY